MKSWIQDLLQTKTWYAAWMLLINVNACMWSCSFSKHHSISSHNHILNRRTSMKSKLTYKLN